MLYEGVRTSNMLPFWKQLGIVSRCPAFARNMGNQTKE
jgi:hypothetical protein